LQLDAECIPGINWWLLTSALQERVSLGQQGSRETVTIDVSEAGWGALWQGCPVRGQ